MFLCVCRERSLFSEVRKSFFCGIEGVFFLRSKRSFFEVEILEFPVETGENRRSVVFCTDAFSAVSYKKKWISQKFYWEYFSNFCIRFQG
jgi:hypothetical protein